MLRKICAVMLNDKVESTVIALRVGVDNLEKHLRWERLRWFGHIVKKDEEVKKMSVGVENRRAKKERQVSEMME